MMVHCPNYGLPNYVDKEKFMCDECPSVFMQKHQLKTHNDNVHSNETMI